MRCEKCGAENKEDARFCRVCGTPLKGGAPTKALVNKTAIIITAIVLTVGAAVGFVLLGSAESATTAKMQESTSEIKTEGQGSLENEATTTDDPETESATANESKSADVSENEGMADDDETQEKLASDNNSDGLSDGDDDIGDSHPATAEKQGLSGEENTVSIDVEEEKGTSSYATLSGLPCGATEYGTYVLSGMVHVHDAEMHQGFVTVCSMTLDNPFDYEYLYHTSGNGDIPSTDTAQEVALEWSAQDTFGTWAAYEGKHITVGCASLRAAVRDASFFDVDTLAEYVWLISDDSGI